MLLPGELVGSPHSQPGQRGADEQGTRDMFMGLGNDGGEQVQDLTGLPK